MYNEPMKLFLSLLLTSMIWGVSSGMTEAEFKQLYEKADKDADTCYKLYKAYSEGDGVEKNDSQARKWILAAYSCGMTSTRREIAKLPWRNKPPFDTRKPTIQIEDPGDQVAHEKGVELVKLFYVWYLGQRSHIGALTLAPHEIHLTKKELARVRQLIAEGADLNVAYAEISSDSPRSALSIAVSAADFETAQLLIDHGADPSANDQAAIMTALEFYDEGEPELRKQNLDSDRTNPERNLMEPPYTEEYVDVMEAFSQSSSPERQKMLQKEKKKREKSIKKMGLKKRVVTADYPKNDLLPPAAKLTGGEKRMLRILEYLADNGADLTIWNNAGYSLAYKVVARSCPFALPLLVEKGMDINQPQNPCEAVSGAYTPKVFNYFLNTGFVSKKAVALDRACSGAMIDAVRIMLRLGVDPFQAGERESDVYDRTRHLRDSCTNPSYVKRYNDILTALEQLKRTKKSAAPDEKKGS